MARISKYTQDNEIIKDDSLLGTDFTSKATRNFSIETINNYLAKQSNILGNIFVYKYDQNQSYSNLGQGLISFNNNSTTNTPFSAVTTVYLNKINAEDGNVQTYIEEIRSKDGVLTIYNSSNTLSFGVYRVQKINFLTNDVIQLTVDSLASNGTLTGGDQANMTAMFQNSDKTAVKQISAQTVWNINHSLNKYPSVSVVDTGNNLVYGDVQYTSLSNLTITFSADTSGTAYLN